MLVGFTQLAHDCDPVGLGYHMGRQARLPKNAEVVFKGSLQPVVMGGGGTRQPCLPAHDPAQSHHARESGCRSSARALGGVVCMAYGGAANAVERALALARQSAQQHDRRAAFDRQFGGGA
jgi:hypothetical protein